MQHHTKAGYRLLAVVTVFSFLSLFFSGSCVRNQERGREDPSRYFFGISDHVTCDAVKTGSVEELLPSDHPSITRSHNSRGVHQPKGAIYYLTSSLISLFAAVILCVIMRFADNMVSYCRRHIIKYIHDQDGHKEAILRSTDAVEDL